MSHYPEPHVWRYENTELPAPECPFPMNNYFCTVSGCKAVLMLANVYPEGTCPHDYMEGNLCRRCRNEVTS